MRKRRGIETGIPVREVMSTVVITARETDSVEEVAKLMRDKSIGSIIIIDSKGNPTGIITDRDVVTRVVARNLLPSNLQAKDIMSTPLRTVEPSMDIGEAAKLMNERRIRRLLIMDEGRIVGIITDRSIFSMMPELIDLIAEKARVSGEEVVTEAPPLAGYCDNCAQWSDKLREIEGKFICEDCRAELETET